MKKTIVMTVIGAATILGAMTCASAAELTSYNNKCVVETPDNGNWAEVKDPETVMTLSDGADKVTIKEYTKEDTLKPVLSDSAFEEVYQTFYSTKDAVYEITGYAVTIDSVNEVRSVVESFQLKDHVKKAEQKTEQKEEQKKEEKKSGIDKKENGEVLTVYNKLGKAVVIYECKDGEYYQEDGTPFQYIGEFEWIDYYGNHYITEGATWPEDETEEKSDLTGNTCVVYNELGRSVTLYEHKDGNYYQEDGTPFQYIGNHEWIDYYGNHYIAEGATWPEDEQDAEQDTEEGVYDEESYDYAEYDYVEVEE